MGPSTKKLLDVAGGPFLMRDISFGLDNLERFGNNGRALKDLLITRNGFFCFEQALRVYPSATSDISWGLHEWNRRDLWKEEYGSLADGIFCFSEDIFCNQFFITEDYVGLFNTETAETEIICSDIEDWSSKILKDYLIMTGYRFAHEWQSSFGRLPPRHRLMPKKPFVLGGPFDLSNLTAVESVRVMKNLGNLARQIHDLPDGATIQFKII